MKLIKYLQYQGIGSRKQCQWLIRGGYVSINGICMDDTDADIDSSSVETLDIDGKAVTVIPEPYFYILLNKPTDYETHTNRSTTAAYSACSPTICETSICRRSAGWMRIRPAYC